MLTRIEESDFENLKFTGKEIEHHIWRLQNELESKFEARRTFVRDYNAERLKVLQREMAERGLVCCTYNLDYPGCDSPVPKNEAVFLFIEHAELHRRGSDYTRRDEMENDKRLFLLCPAHAQAMRDRHGSRGAYDETSRTTPFFNAFEVKCLPDGLCMRRFGDEIKLTDEQVATLKALPQTFIDLYSIEWDLLPELKKDQNGKIIIPDLEPVPAE